MYELEDVVAKGKFYTSVPDASSITMDELMSQYEDIHFRLSHFTEPGVELVLRLADVYDLVYKTDRTVTVQRWLELLGDRTLPVNRSGIEITRGQVVQTDLLDVGFNVTPLDEQYQPSAHKHNVDMIHLLLEDGSGRYQEYHDYCLFTCNGLLHRHDANRHGIYIECGATSVKQESKMQLSSISFYELGKIKIYPITLDMIQRHEGGRYRDGFYLNIPEIDLSDKTVMLSICGILHYNNSGYDVVSHDSIKVHWSRVGLVDRYIDFRHKIDWDRVKDRIDLSEQENNIFIQRSLSEEDDVILSALTLSQTFIIVLDAKDVDYDRRTLERTGVPGRFISHTPPVGPVMIDNGLMHAARVRKESNGLHSITIADPWIRNKVEDTRETNRTLNVMTNDQSQSPKYLSDAYELLITKERVVV